MKNKMVTHILTFVLVVHLLSGCGAASTSKTTEEQKVGLAGINTLFTANDAEKILGEPTHLDDSSTARSGDAVITYHLTYKANGVDDKTGKTGALYILIERYREIPHAQSKYSNILKANEDHEGIRVLDDLGYEAYFHSDGTNFLFIMARKGGSVLTMKVNKITSHTSREEFDRVAKEVIDKL